MYGINEPGVQLAVRDMLLALGLDPNDPAIIDTPSRVARAWKEQLAGYAQKAEDILVTAFDAPDYDEIVLLRSIPFYSTCEHHLLPFHGLADVAYIPQKGRVVGLSKLARLVEMHARRLQLQERMTSSIADDLQRCLEPVAVGVVVEAQHMCMCARGVEKPGAAMVTSVMRGSFREKPASRAELMAMLRRNT